MRYFALVLIIYGLLSIDSAQAVKFKLYHCQSSQGTVVVQDRPCAVTQMKSVKPGSQINNRHKVAPTKKKQKYTPKTLSQAGVKSTHNITPQVFIDYVDNKNWPSKLSQNHHGWRLNIQVPVQHNSQNMRQLSVQHFYDPQVTLNQDAFSYALNLYHEIRHQYRLIDSKFKSHSGYKIFNITYHKNERSAQSEFYVSKLDGSLWVFTLESSQAGMAKTQQIMAQLQALI